MTSWVKKEIQRKRNEDIFYVEKIAKELQELTPEQKQRALKMLIKCNCNKCYRRTACLCSCHKS